MNSTTPSNGLKQRSRALQILMRLLPAALWRRLARGEEPPSAYRAIPVGYGPDSPEGQTRRSLLIGGLSVAPNSFALGLDEEAGVVVVHELVPARPKAAR